MATGRYEEVMGDKDKLEQKLVDAIDPFDYVPIALACMCIFFKQHFLKKHGR